jgi:acetyl-CoA acetyltransferase
MQNIRGKTAIVGIGYSKLERRSSRLLGEIAKEAARAAIADAGLQVSDIDGLTTVPTLPAYANTGLSSREGVDVVSVPGMIDLLGIAEQITWFSHGSSLVTNSLFDAVNALAAGACTHALVWRAVHVPPGRYSNVTSKYVSGNSQFQVPFGYTSPVSWHAITAQRYMAQYGATREHMATFVVDNRRKTNLNPKAYWFDTPLTKDEYLNARMISDPMTIYDCDIPVDGCAAIVLTTAERAKDLRQPPAYVTAYAQTSIPSRSGFTDPEFMREGGEHLARKLWQAAGIGPKDVGAAMLYDGFSIFVYYWLESMGFCKRGEAYQFIEDGHTTLEGSLPLNTNGCSLGEGRTHGMSHLSEAELQVMGRAEARQVPGVEHVVATVSAGNFVSAGLVLSRSQT